MHPDWLSNAFVIADGRAGPRSSSIPAPTSSPLVAAVEAWGVTPGRDPPHALAHPDHVVHEDELRARYGIGVVAEPGSWEWGDLQRSRLRDPGPLRRHGRLRDRRRGRLHRRHPVQGRGRRRRPRPGAGLRDGRVHDASGRACGCCPATRTRRRSAASARRTRSSASGRGAEPEGTERVDVGGRDATLVVWSPDYDGKGKAWVRFDDGTDAIVGGSRVTRR